MLESFNFQVLLCSYLLEVKMHIKELYKKVKFTSYNHFMNSLESCYTSL